MEATLWLTLGGASLSLAILVLKEQSLSVECLLPFIQQCPGLSRIQGMSELLNSEAVFGNAESYNRNSLTPHGVSVAYSA